MAKVKTYAVIVHNKVTFKTSVPIDFWGERQPTDPDYMRQLVFRMAVGSPRFVCVKDFYDVVAWGGGERTEGFILLMCDCGKFL
jgi:hypothetical protein